MGFMCSSVCTLRFGDNLALGHLVLPKVELS